MHPIKRFCKTRDSNENVSFDGMTYADGQNLSFTEKKCFLCAQKTPLKRVLRQIFQGKESYNGKLKIWLTKGKGLPTSRTKSAKHSFALSFDYCNKTTLL